MAKTGIILALLAFSMIFAPAYADVNWLNPHDQLPNPGAPGINQGWVAFHDSGDSGLIPLAVFLESWVPIQPVLIPEDFGTFNVQVPNVEKPKNNAGIWSYADTNVAETTGFNLNCTVAVTEILSSSGATNIAVSNTSINGLPVTIGSAYFPDTQTWQYAIVAKNDRFNDTLLISSRSHRIDFIEGSIKSNLP